MPLPVDIAYVRHGESVGNIASRAFRSGDPSHYTEEFLDAATCRWELTDKGREQAALAGQWILKHLVFDPDRMLVSPYDRTLETAEHLQLPSAEWLIEEDVRERSRGDAEHVHPNMLEDTFAENLKALVRDPYYHRWPNGENYPDTKQRVKWVLGRFEKHGSQGGLVVTHGDFMNAVQMTMEHIDSIQWQTERHQSFRKIWNTQILHYSRKNPETGETGPRMAYVRTVRPWRERKSGPRKGSLYLFDEPGEWREIPRRLYSNQALRELRLLRNQSVGED